MKQNNTVNDFTPIQLKMPVDMGRIIKISDPVYSFSEIMAHIDLHKYFAEEERKTGRPEYDREKLLKVTLFAFMEFGYCSVRQIAKLCETDIRFLFLLDEENAPSFMTIQKFIHNELQKSIDEIFTEINETIFSAQDVDQKHAYIDGTKLKANAGNYTWVWKKTCIKNRNKVFAALTQLLRQVNERVTVCRRASFEVRQEYSVEYVEYIMETFLEAVGMAEADFVHGSGKRKTQEQKLYEELAEYRKRLKSCSEHVRICGEKRNSYSKTDHGATFMRVKRDYMGNDQLLPAYNVQAVVCDEYIAHYGVFPFASDMDCFQPLLEGFRARYGFYPQYPVADAGYGSFNNYLYCEETGMEKYMKFTMYDKESKDRRYHENPYRAGNFPIDKNGVMRCPNGKRFFFLRTAPVKGNRYGRTEEYYQCEDCEGCVHREQCHKGQGNRIVRMNEELTMIHEEVLRNLNSTHGALLRMNRSIQAEGTYGSVKWNRGYTRFRRRGLNGVILEFGIICCGFNLHKYHLARMEQQKTA
jgi:transposase